MSEKEEARVDQEEAEICRECGRELGAGYLCDDCDQIEVAD